MAGGAGARGAKRGWHTFWNRISEGEGPSQLWSQFRSETRASYRLYSQEISWERLPGEGGVRRFLRISQAFFWAMMMKLSPGRRVLLLIALVLLFWPAVEVRSGNNTVILPNLSFFGGIVLLILLALELADRVSMKRDLQIAREIQSWLMPSSPPQRPGIDVAFATRPANTVAGDYYDAFFRSVQSTTDSPGESSRESLMLVVADVAGKSVPAALLMATLQASLHTLAELSPALLELVTRLNHYACAQNLGRQRFTTAFLADWECETGVLTYVNAGHNWPVLRRKSGEVERLQTGGLPLGITPHATYESGSVVIDPGDVLLIFTDGIVEAENSKEEEFGEARMLECFCNAGAHTAPEVLRQMLSAVDAFVGSATQHDDMTCVILRNCERATQDRPVVTKDEIPASAASV